MKQVFKLIVFSFLVLFYDTAFGESYKLANKTEEIQIILNKDSVEVIIENKSKKTIYLPAENAIVQNYSDKNGILAIEFGIDLQVFNERGRFQLTRLEPNEKKSYKVKLIECSGNKRIHFTYQFYLRKDKEKNNSKMTYNTVFISDKNWLKKGDWEWGELMIATYND